jgi:large subunit ribosomal protein L29
MDIDKVRALTDTELLTELVAQRRNLYDLRFQLATRQLTDHSQLTGTRRSIARILTVITERALDENMVPRPAPPARAATRSTTTKRAPRAKAATTTGKGDKR